ncbi:multidrug resistance-associated protein 1-like [Physella acuta]|uniref:multidrug resistance-associated protein 1-like n=1 Tax=Physella acuta TaxID=109671 RepID=UPI0027DE6C02|nr:multidrug resistance-associated protein 1-like [Physella acuta]
MTTKKETACNFRRESKRSNKMEAETKKMDCLLFQVLIKSFGWEIFLSYVCGAISELLNFAGLLIFRELIRHAEEKTPEPTWYVYFLSLAMLVASWCQTIFHHQHLQLAMTSGMRMKTALMAAVYKKILFVKTKHQEQRGEIMLLNDCENVQDFMSYSSMVLSMPLQILLATYLLWNTVGLLALSGVGLFLLLVFLASFLAYLQDQLHVKDVSLKNEITKMNMHTLNVCKNNTQWTNGTLRQRKDNAWTKLAGIKAVRIFINTAWPYVVCLATFAAHFAIYPEQPLTAEKAFVTIAVFIYLQYPIEVIPEIVSATSKAAASMMRIEEYLCREELDDSYDNKLDRNGTKSYCY